MYDLRGKRVAVFGGSGMLGSALVRRLQSEECTVIAPSSRDVDLVNPIRVRAFFNAEAPDVVFMAAGLCGGIKFNMEHQKEMLYENTIMSMNVLKECDHSLIENVVYFGSSCMYPKDANQPMREFQIGTGELEKSNRGYALAKLAATEFATQLGYMTIVPCNLYGPNDDFSDSGHVIGSLIAKFEAPGDTVKVWGTGQAIREFLHVDDCADAAVFLAQHRAAAGPINVGSGEGASIDTLARLINLITDRNKEIVFDTTKPDGMMRKVMCVDKLKGWSPKINLIAGIQRLVKEYRDGK